MDKQPVLAFIGAGNMARAIIGGLISNGYPANKIWASEPDAERLSDLKVQGLQTTTDNNQAVMAADAVILAVKPQVLKPVTEAMKDAVQAKQPVIISVAAGILSTSIDRWLGGNTAIVRCMPNTPALVGTGASGLYANSQVSDEQRSAAETILKATGITLWVDEESQLDAVTAVSGSGPAYYFLVMESMIQAGKKLGLSEEVATKLTLQTALGAAQMASSSDVDPAELRRRVTSPNGTTEQAIKTFMDEGLPATFEKALQACNDRSEELAKELGDA
ncbi:pyrroline-5-carboxylate reductase [Neptuniibacter caesariensis]|uniref:Pyrroline-5-carboxylate reductase n=1 Tax=Neptuniibacter caesariensis TaxID=207954 RepID=A0A7U8GSU6_NEPCE|nr:pyrroline-5-carboxylate reductase [Neptuniibacter caesariensis]EAR62877.1 pyrroline-5-carboxylate reductase [Oceanospirillum sp. MED92] [Neptuniibacter caesariensis]